MTVRTPVAATAALALLALTGCSTASPAQAPHAEETISAVDGHGAVPGVSEAAEPQLHLVSIDAAGNTSMLDLLNGGTSLLGNVGEPARVTSDGRYVFASTENGVDILDSGVWTWDHGDHFHYYRGAPQQIGHVAGDGTATIATGMLSTAGTTGMFFPSTGTALLLDNSALSGGAVSEVMRLDVQPHAGIIAPLGEGALVTAPDESGRAATLRAVNAGGAELATAECPAAAGTITTRAGVVIGCADGAVIATDDAGTPILRHVPYPEGSAAPATAFDARKGRPTVAGVGKDAGVWLLNTRQRTWDWLPTTTPVIAAAAVDDAGNHVVALGTDGTVQVCDGSTGQLVGASGPLLAASLGDPALAGTVELTVDGQRAYVSAPAEGVVYEIDYADGARVARTLEMPTRPVHLAETGR